MKSSGLHAALQLAVEALRERTSDFSKRCERLNAADIIRDFLRRKRLASKLSMRRSKRTRRARPARR